ncbi:MAG: Crp/Fnr family transcriptional regulator [Planctomycetes bacterium]|nr:Crp/Fnr family transcriptional regulator [Planctomycetota bacterium]
MIDCYPMDLAERQLFLTRLPHFRPLSRKLVERIAQATTVRDLDIDQALISEGQPANSFFAVVSGRIRVYRIAADGHEQVLHHVHDGQSFAEPALLSMGRYPAHARAVVASKVLEIGGQAFVSLVHGEPGVATAMIGSLCMWLVRMAERVEELSIASAPARLAHYLLALPASPGAEHLEVDLPMTKKDLAAHLAITPETLSRLLRRWQDAGVIENRQRSIVVLDSRVLVGIADRLEDSGP